MNNGEPPGATLSNPNVTMHDSNREQQNRKSKACKPTVFISHSTRDQEFVGKQLIPFLQQRGIRTWYSKQSIHVTEHWEKSIKKGLAACEWFLVVLSEQSVQSDWVQAEVHWALQSRPNRVIPIVMDDCHPEDCHLQLGRIQHIDFRQKDAMAWQTLLAVWQDPQPDMPPQVSTRRVPLWRRLPGVVPIVFLCLCIAVVVTTILAIWYLQPKPVVPPEPKVKYAVMLGKAAVTSKSIEQKLKITIPPEQRARYVQHNQGADLVIRYEMPYLRLHAKGGPLKGTRYLRFGWELPTLSVTIANSTEETVVVNRATVRVVASAVNEEPVILIADGWKNQLAFINEGWGPVVDPIVEYRLVTSDKPQHTPGYSSGKIKPTRSTFDPNLFTVSVDNIQAFENEQIVPVHGQISYGPKEQRRTKTFLTNIRIRKTPPDNEVLSGIPVPPTYIYDLGLEAGTAPFTHHIAAVHKINPGEVDHFQICIRSDRSAKYVLQIALHGLDDTVLHKQIVHLNVFMPRVLGRVQLVQKNHTMSNPK